MTSFSRSSKGSDYAEHPHGQCPENRPLAEAMRHNPGYGIMAEFVQRRPVKVDLVSKGRLRRNLHIVAAHIIEGARTADAEIRTRRGNQRFRAFMLFAGR